MALPEPSNERRGLARAARRLGCWLLVDGRRHTAVVLDLSATGLFVRTHLSLDPGSAVHVIVRRPGGEVWEIETEVARIRADAGGPLISGRGLGLQIVEAPEEYQRFVAALRE